MTEALSPELDRRLAELREAFDRSFGEPPKAPDPAAMALVLATVGSGCVALPIAELAGVARIEARLDLPGGRPGLLGVAGIRGRLVAVFGLADLLGLGSTSNAHWLALVRGQDQLAFGVDEIAGLIQATPAAVMIPEELPGPFLARVLIGADGTATPILDVKAAVAALAGG